MDGDIETEVLAMHGLAEIAGLVGLVDGFLQGSHLRGVFSPDVNVGVVAVDRITADDDALDEQVRILDQDVAIFEGGRLGFIRVDRQIGGFVQILG